MDKKRKILVMAYAISPNKGSEFSVAWNYVKNMSEENKRQMIDYCEEHNIKILDAVQRSA